ncbi:hypothetical protein JOB18_006816 [Solea senegalensis]|uniref:Uncharacterized protein n=1 Tax=Solea senegalensis TaxID=28829 RepID=A0AAV6S8W4_SOLSE|nr:hypothetical protein JOB18_006816 [Solea senegalensis]
MDRHQTGQEEKLVEVKMEMDNLEVDHQPRASTVSFRACFKCMVALATVMGLVIVILVAGFILHYFVYMPSSSQDAPTLRGAVKVISAHSLKKRDEEGTYDLFTVDKAATYLIYGWVKLSDITSEDVVLMQTFKEDERVIEKKKAERSEVFFFKRKLLVNNSTVSIHFKSAYTDGLFHVYEV